MFQRLFVRTILCFIISDLICLIAADTTIVPSPISITFNASTVSPSSGTTAAPANVCSQPPGSVDLNSCCDLPMPVPVETLKVCQTSQDAWLKDKKNATCGSICLLNHLVNITEAIQLAMSNPPQTLIQNLNSYLNALFKCFKNVKTDVRFDLATKLLTDGTAFHDVLCDVGLVNMAECINMELFLNCTTFSKNVQCQSVRDFLETPCRFSEL
ncbi:uncharacterized protein LOC134213958 [Armigeres subalbatus]|uniref:uncharacterized protein LOC134213958 n=1 Tax=Armigeres subalbatus TaxID=124917 RepID=UPI002ED2B1E0